LYIAIGIIGATVMPHNLYLHSSLVQTRNFDRTPDGIKQALKYNFIDSTIALNLAFFVNAAILILAAAWICSPALAAEKARGRILGKKRDLPLEVKDPDITQESADNVPQMLLAVLGHASDAALAAEARRLKADLATVPGVAGIDLRGDQQPAVRVRLDPVRLARHGLSPAQVVQALQGANARIPGGEYLLASMVTLLEVNQSFPDAPAIAGVPLAGSPGKPLVRLGDVADVTDGHLLPRNRFLSHGTQGVALEIRFRSEADAVTVGGALRDRLETLKPPAGLQTRILHDQPRAISRSVAAFTRSLVEGMALVMLVITLGLGWRPALVVTGVIPLAMGGALTGMLLLGFSLDAISLAGLTLALGLLVDDAVVVAESVQLMRDKGLSALRAAVLGTARVFHANNGTTAVAMVSFIPLFFMGSDIRQFISGIPTAVILALGTSNVVAQFVTPWLTTFILKKPADVDAVGNDQPFSRHDDLSLETERNRGMAWLRKVFGSAMPWVTGNPGKVCATAFLLLAGSLALIPVVGLQFFPKSDKPYLFVTLELAQGTHLDRTQAKVQEGLAILARDPAIESLSAMTGAGFPPVIGDRTPPPDGSHVGDILVHLKEGQDPGQTAIRLRASLGDLVGAAVSVNELWLGPPVEHPIQVRVHGDDYGRLRTLAEEIKQQLRLIPGTHHVTDTLSDTVPLTRVDIDPERAQRLGLLPGSIGQSLRLLHGEDKVTEFRRGDEAVQVVLEAAPDPERPYAALEETPIPNAAGALIPLKEAGRARLDHGYAQLQRRNSRRVVQINADVQADVLPSLVIGRLDPWLKARNWEPGYGFVYAGEQEEVAKSFTNLALAALGALILIAALLLLMFDDFVLAGLVVLLVPFSLVGALPGLALTGNHFGFMAFLGLIALTGVYVNHKIYFLDRMLELFHRGEPLTSAIYHAGQDRLRPVVLTALTAILGLLPLTLFGGPMWGAFGWVNIFGLLASIPLSLIVLPAFVLVAGHLRERLSSKPTAVI
ncbi:MAG: MMPL family transporter, partial [Holophaga sp.]|nr:MMPL family transporter [Holophaga sp.]